MKQDGYKIISEAVDEEEESSNVSTIVSGTLITGVLAVAIIKRRNIIRQLRSIYKKLPKVAADRNAAAQAKRLTRKIELEKRALRDLKTKAYKEKQDQWLKDYKARVAAKKIKLAAKEQQRIKDMLLDAEAIGPRKRIAHLQKTYTKLDYMKSKAMAANLDSPARHGIDARYMNQMDAIDAEIKMIKKHFNIGIWG